MEYMFIKINFKGAVNYVKINKHEAKWEYKDYILSAAMHANISAYDIDFFTDFQDVQINEEDFIDIINKYENHPDFQLKIVLKKNYNDLHRNPTRVFSRQNFRLGYQMHINAQDVENFILQTHNAYILNKKTTFNESLQSLLDVETRAIIREGVNYLTSRYSYHPHPTYIIALSLAIVELFPQLKTNQFENGGIDTLYDRKKNRGYIISRLNRVRQKLYNAELNFGKNRRKRHTEEAAVSAISKSYENSHSRDREMTG